MNDSRVDNSQIILATKGCPGTGCNDERNKERIIYWGHSCGSTSYLDRYAKVKCYKCDTNYLILEAKFKCKYDNQYRDCDHLKLARILCALASIESARVNISKFNSDELSNFLNDVTDELFVVKKPNC